MTKPIELPGDSRRVRPAGELPRAGQGQRRHSTLAPPRVLAACGVGERKGEMSFVSRLPRARPILPSSGNSCRTSVR